MIKFLSKQIVVINLDNNKKSYMNTEYNRIYLQSILPEEVWNEIESAWGKESLFTGQEAILNTEEKNILQQEIIEKMKNECVKTISNGIDFDNTHYSFEITDQLNLSRLAIQAKEGKENLIYHADGEACRIFTAEEIIELYELMEAFIEYHTTYFNALKMYIKTLEYKSDLLKVEYGMEIPTNNALLSQLSI